MHKNKRDIGAQKERLAQQPDLVPISPPAGRALVLLCEKCGRKLDAGDENPSRRLQKEIKRAGIERFGKRQVRAVMTSCMDVCPKKKISACIVPFASDGRANKAPYVVECNGSGLEELAIFLVNSLED